jgi:tetratricopeptide (TPR) repeat protein
MARSRHNQTSSLPRPHSRAAIPLWLVVALAAVVGLAAYWNGLHAPFIWDDEPAIVSNQTIRAVLPLSESLSPPLETAVAGRPLVNLSLAINYAVGSLDETGYHAWNLAVLILSGLLLYGIVRRTIVALGRRDDAGDIALVSALVWLAHPLLTETVEYTTQRTESMMGLFFLLTLYAAIRARTSRGWLAGAILACAAGMATKESMAVAPLAVLLYDRVFLFPSFRDAFRERAGLYAGLTATWVELAILMALWPRSTVGAAQVSTWTYLLNQAGMIVRYLGLSLWPRSLVLDYGLPRPLGVADVLPQILLLLALLAATIVALARWPALGFLGAMFFLTLAPTSSLVPITSEVGAERRMYLPLAALSVFVVTLGWIGLDRFRARQPGRARALTVAGTCVAAALIAALVARTAVRNRDYRSAMALWESDVATRPHGRARFALATEYVTAGRHAEAIAQLRDAVVDYPDARAGLGAELFFAGKTDEAISVLDAFIHASPSNPNRIPARLLMGQALLSLGRLDEGANEFRTVLQADPSSIAANQGLASVARIHAARLLEQGDAARAADQAREALRLNSGDADAHNILGVALASRGQIAEATREFQTTLRINPQHEQATRNLARAMSLTQAPKP